jgi:hypothetical protein
LRLMKMMVKKFLYPTFEEFSKYIERRCVTLDNLENIITHNNKKSSFVISTFEIC